MKSKSKVLTLWSDCFSDSGCVRVGRAPAVPETILTAADLLWVAQTAAKQAPTRYGTASSSERDQCSTLIHMRMLVYAEVQPDNPGLRLYPARYSSRFCIFAHLVD